MSPSTITILFLLFAIVMFVMEKIPLGVTSMIVCVGLIVTGVLDAKTAFADFIDSGVNTKAFDGLDKALTGSSTEYNKGNTIDLSTSELVTNNFQYFLDMLDEFLGGLDGTPSFIAGNNKLIAKLRACARRASMYSVTKDNWGNQVESYGGIPFIDMKTKPGTNDEVIDIDSSSGETSLYVARLGMDGLHAVSFAGVAPVQTWLPDFTTAGAVKKGEVEMNAAIALKASKAAGVFRGIKVK